MGLEHRREQKILAETLKDADGQNGIGGPRMNPEARKRILGMAFRHPMLALTGVLAVAVTEVKAAEGIPVGAPWETGLRELRDVATSGEVSAGAIFFQTPDGKGGWYASGEGFPGGVIDTVANMQAQKAAFTASAGQEPGMICFGVAHPGYLAPGVPVFDGGSRPPGIQTAATLAQLEGAFPGAHVEVLNVDPMGSGGIWYSRLWEPNGNDLNRFPELYDQYMALQEPYRRLFYGEGADHQGLVNERLNNLSDDELRSLHRMTLVSADYDRSPKHQPSAEEMKFDIFAELIHTSDVQSPLAVALMPTGELKEAWVTLQRLRAENSPEHERAHLIDLAHQWTLASKRGETSQALQHELTLAYADALSMVVRYVPPDQISNEPRCAGADYGTSPMEDSARK